jgi:antitoxin FitA
MPVDLSVKQVDDEVAARLRERAKRNHRSLQGELKAILEEAVLRQPARSTMAEAIARLDALGLSTPSEAVQLVREGREERTRHLERVLDESRARHARRR